MANIKIDIKVKSETSDVILIIPSRVVMERFGMKFRSDYFSKVDAIFTGNPFSDEAMSALRNLSPQQYKVLADINSAKGRNLYVKIDSSGTLKAYLK